MGNIVQKSTLATDTGTGATYVPYRMDGDKAVLRESAPSAQPGFLSFARTEPKPTRDYAGAMKGEVRLRREVADADGRLWPCIVSVSSSLPAFMTDTARAAFVTEAIIAAREATALDALSKVVIPQS
jgi:hypothetical protein